MNVLDLIGFQLKDFRESGMKLSNGTYYKYLTTFEKRKTNLKRENFDAQVSK
jgi:hypothetical protein